MAPLIESTGYGEAVKYVNDFNKYKKEFNESGNDIKKKTSIVKKLTDLVKGLFNWWFKEEPDKKFKELRFVLKLSLAITALVLIFKAPGAGKLANKILPTNVGTVFRKIGYKGSSNVLRVFFSAESILLNTIRILYGKIVGKIYDLGEKVHDKINMKDIDANIEAYEKASKEIEDKICDHKDELDENTLKVLRQQKNALDDTVAELVKVKSRCGEYDGATE